MIDFDEKIGVQEFVNDSLMPIGKTYDSEYSIHDNLRIAYSILRRIPSTVPRAFIELPDIVVPADLQAGYRELIRRFVEGKSVLPYLSTSTANPCYKDSLLNSWGLHHLHLCNEPHPTIENFNDRTGPVLFMKIFDNVAIAIDILQHGRGFSDVWVNDHLIKKLHNHLPESLSRYKMNVTGAEYTHQEHKKLRKSNANYAMRMPDGTSYVLMGTMASGDALDDQLLLARFVRDIDYFKQIISHHEHDIRNSINLANDVELQLTVKFENKLARLFHPASGTLFNFSSPSN